MSDEEDYLSDQFLLNITAASSSAPTTYSQRRKDAQRLATIKNEQNRKKSRRQLEEESRQEGLSKSLFERAKEEEGSGQQNKALAMMLKMGFKPGQSLGGGGGEGPSTPIPASKSVDEEETQPGKEPFHTDSAGPPQTASRHLAAPLPLNEWAGKKGIGLGKRAASPNAAERLSKMAKMEEARDQGAFRDRARQEYEERRAEGRLAPAQRTCVTLDEKAGRKLNVLWLNPSNPDTFPEDLLEYLEDEALQMSLRRYQSSKISIEDRLRAQIQADALQPVKTTLDEIEESAPILPSIPYPEEYIEEANQFLRLSAQDRLTILLEYLRHHYFYCFWCGTQYESVEDLEENCPGTNEDDHD